jgi:hypothetical protein
MDGRFTRCQWPGVAIHVLYEVLMYTQLQSSMAVDQLRKGTVSWVLTINLRTRVCTRRRKRLRQARVRAQCHACRTLTQRLGKPPLEQLVELSILCKSICNPIKSLDYSLDYSSIRNTFVLLTIRQSTALLMYMCDSKITYIHYIVPYAKHPPPTAARRP